ncbi:MAG: hypothetical protein MUE94_00310 [Verrucomicrobia bacterium]|jgi:hypothetical protein|nr:hypothetical protein [Verrucomicrobiota bacterium]
MEKAPRYGWTILLLGLWLAGGCADTDAPPPQELTIEELNAALTYLEKSGKPQPQSIYDLTNLPALRGKVFPNLPEGQYFSIDPEKNQVTIEIDHLPDMPDAFPHQRPFWGEAGGKK